jgi:uncharacterized repeat protein (TIGR03803 family)
MQIFRRSRYTVAIALTLLCGVMRPALAARTQEANFIRLTAAVSADSPSAIRGDMLLASDGNIYFVSSTGGSAGYGAVGKLAPDGTISTVHGFPKATDAGVRPYAGVIQASDGDLYGTTYLGGVEGAGAIYKLTTSGQYTLLRSLGATATDAAFPYAGLVQAPDGYLYGTSHRGGNNDKGTVFKISLTGTEFTILHHFNGDDGENPQGRLIVGHDGLLYGTTLQGGSGGRGTVYKISTSGALTSLYSFPRLSAFNSVGVAVNATGANPRSGLLLAADGNYYGTAYQGGPGGGGTIFRVTPAGELSVFYGFSGPRRDGSFPLAVPVQDAAGNFYGTTANGGYQDVGTAWRISPTGQFTLLHGFVDSGTDGGNPYNGLLQANGAIYGASFTNQAGTGSLFKLDLGSSGALPVELSVTPTDATCVSIEPGQCGISATITWSSPTAASCKATGAWANTDRAASGSEALTLGNPGTYTYALSCTDGAGIVRNAYAAIVATAPESQPVDGGAGTGSLSVLLLLLLAALLFRKTLREIVTPCP